jgi:CheY-like chemotaxis protein
MPEVDGYEAARRIRDSRHHHIPVIAFTAHVLESERQKCLDAGMDDCLTKPVQLGELEKALRRFRSGRLITTA